MADYSISYTSTTIIFTVTGLSSGDQVRFFVRYEPAPADGSMLEDGSIIYTASGEQMVQSFDVLVSGQRYATNVYVNGVHLGVQYFSVDGRPADWKWEGIYVGAPYENLTPKQWNDFTDRINAFRAYKGIPPYHFTTAISGVTLLAVCVLEAITAINDISGHGAVPTKMVLSVACFTQLANALNAVQ